MPRVPIILCLWVLTSLAFSASPPFEEETVNMMRGIKDEVEGGQFKRAVSALSVLLARLKKIKKTAKQELQTVFEDSIRGLERQEAALQKAANEPNRDMSSFNLAYARTHHTLATQYLWEARRHQGKKDVEQAIRYTAVAIIHLRRARVNLGEKPDPQLKKISEDYPLENRGVASLRRNLSVDLDYIEKKNKEVMIQLRDSQLDSDPEPQ